MRTQRVQRTVAAAIGFAAFIGCSPRRPKPDPDVAAQLAAGRRATCAQDVLRQYPQLAFGPPPAPVRPVQNRARAPREWADYDRDLARYSDEYRRYEILRRTAEDRIALECDRAAARGR